MTRSSKYSLFSLACLCMLLLNGCSGGANGQETADGKDAEKEILPTPVEVAAVTLGDISAVYTGTASLEADGEATVMAKVGGEIIALLVNEGDTVKAGDPVAKLDDERLRLEVKRSKASLDKTRQEYQRNVELHAKGLIPAGTFEGMKYDLDALKVAYELAQLELSYATVRAPIDGVISERLVKAGNTITANAGVFRITDLNPLLAYLHVPEREYSKLAKGQPVELTLDALPGQRFIGEIAMIGPVIDPKTATFKVTTQIHDHSGRLTPGMFGRVSIAYDTREGVPLVPRAALLSTDSETSVFVVDNDVAVRRDISVGYSSGGEMEVVAGLQVGDQVVVIGQSGLKNDAKVHVIPPGASVAKIKPKSDKDKK